MGTVQKLLEECIRLFVTGPLPETTVALFIASELVHLAIVRTVMVGLKKIGLQL